MNPSTADPLFDDPTIAKCGRFARRWGYGHLLVGNTFAYCASEQLRLADVADPIGPENGRHLCDMAGDAPLVVLAYGKPKLPALRERGMRVAEMLRDMGVELHALNLLDKHTPGHILYIREDTPARHVLGLWRAMQTATSYPDTTTSPHHPIDGDDKEIYGGPDPSLPADLALSPTPRQGPHAQPLRHGLQPGA